jgi:hypothetical protein
VGRCAKDQERIDLDEIDLKTLSRASFSGIPAPFSSKCQVDHGEAITGT